MPTGALDDLISKSRIFQLLDQAGRERMAGIAVETKFRQGDVILREGDPGDAFYAILSGTVSVSADDFGNEKHIALLEAGSVFGEIAALTREPRTATLTAKTAVHALKFEMASVLTVLKDYPAVLAELKRLGVTRSEELLEKMQ
jgi:CRP-like cAMP-binding protein